MPDAPETPAVSPNLQNWLSQGEQLYAATLNDFRALEAQLDELEQKLAAKQTEVNHIAQIIGKPTVEGGRRPTAQLTPAPDADPDDRPARLPIPTVTGTVVSPSNSNNATIARALTGRFGR